MNAIALPTVAKRPQRSSRIHTLAPSARRGATPIAPQISVTRCTFLLRCADPHLFLRAIRAMIGGSASGQVHDDGIIFRYRSRTNRHAASSW